jgi:hypothetical protein
MDHRRHDAASETQLLCVWLNNQINLIYTRHSLLVQSTRTSQSTYNSGQISRFGNLPARLEENLCSSPQQFAKSDLQPPAGRELMLSDGQPHFYRLPGH